jgi:hypothetical protein
MGTHLEFNPHSHDHQLWMDPHTAWVDLKPSLVAMRSGPAMAAAA